MKSRTVMAAAAIFVASECVAADLQYMGQPLPEVPIAGTRTVVSDPSSVALDPLPGKGIRHLLSQDNGDAGTLATRGRKEADIYRNAAPAVVLITTGDSLGSGSYLGGGLVLTNWHVVNPAMTVGVMFKPPQVSAALDSKSVLRADVVKTDPTRDLALLKLAALPQSVKPLELGSESELEVGADVHAIGHPTGLIWSYTRGLISQVRADYAWKTKENTVAHRAEVIQTQTPISPGNSGGPLLGDSGKILGVNSFAATEGENLNFAVSVRDLAAFLRGQPQLASATKPPSPPATSASAPSTAKCQTVKLREGRNETNDGYLLAYDTNCDGKPDLLKFIPDDKSKPILALIDSNHDGKTDIVVEDRDRDGRWDISYIDVDYDGVPDLVGYHPDGKLKPSRFERYAAK
jgi:S1-C subfamily serine protease